MIDLRGASKEKKKKERRESYEFVMYYCIL